VVANVQLSIIGVDVLANFSILVDCCNNTLLNGVISLSTPAQKASTRFPTLKTIGNSTSVDDLFAEFTDLTRPSAVPREVRLNTLHHIKTTQSPPVSCRNRRLAPDRLAIHKAEIDALLKEGSVRR
jgi:hypothetical protein